MISSEQAATRRFRVLTGYRPTGQLHVGQWIGNIQNMLALQEQHEAFFFVADWHALTTDHDRTEQLPGNVRGLVLDHLLESSPLREADMSAKPSRAGQS